VSGNDMSYDLFKDYVNSISYTKEKLLDSDDENWTTNYSPYMICKVFSMYKDTILYSNEMNMLHHLDNKLQFDYLLNIIRPSKRYATWPKKKKHRDFDFVKEYYNYSNKKTEVVMDILTECQIEDIKNIMYKGD
jgi:hypothetical protein